VDLEKVRCTTIVPRDNWSGQGLLGADISFGYLNRLPLRRRDIANEKKANQMQKIFGTLSKSQGNRQPTEEGLSSDDELTCSK